MFSSMTKSIVVGALSITLISCYATLREPSIERWPELFFSIDGKVDIQLRVPPAEMQPELLETQLITTALEPTQNMFSALYDPGKWSNRGLLLTRISGTVFRLERNSSGDSNLTLEDVKNDIYLSHPDTSKWFDILGTVTFNDRRWLQVNLIGEQRSGVSYATITGGNYAFVLSMTELGEDSDQTRLFHIRHETLKQVIISTKIWPH